MFLLLTYLPNITANGNTGCQESLFFFFFLQFFVRKYHHFFIFMLLTITLMGLISVVYFLLIKTYPGQDIKRTRWCIKG